MRKPLTVGLVADRLGVSTRTVQRWIESGRLPSFRLPGGGVRIAEQTIELIEQSAGITDDRHDTPSR